MIPNFIPLLGDIDTDATGAPAVAFGVVLILIMLAFPAGAAGLIRQADRARGGRAPPRVLACPA